MINRRMFLGFPKCHMPLVIMPFKVTQMAVGTFAISIYAFSIASAIVILNEIVIIHGPKDII